MIVVFLHYYKAKCMSHIKCNVADKRAEVTGYALATHACLQTDCVKLPLGQRQMVWCCLIGDVITKIRYFSAFGRRIGCPGLV